MAGLPRSANTAKVAGSHDASRCDVEWGVETAGRPTTFYDSDRPTGDSFSYAEVCIVGSGGMIQVDADRTAAVEPSCPYSGD